MNLASTFGALAAFLIVAQLAAGAGVIQPGNDRGLDCKCGVNCPGCLMDEHGCCVCKVTHSVWVVDSRTSSSPKTEPAAPLKPACCTGKGWTYDRATGQWSRIVPADEVVQPVYQPAPQYQMMPSFGGFMGGGFGGGCSGGG